jgi:hypothetical protein
LGKTEILKNPLKHGKSVLCLSNQKASPETLRRP